MITRLFGLCIFKVILYDIKLCSIWMMQEYSVVESWSKQFSICLEGGLGTMMGVKRNGEVLVAEGIGEPPGEV
ncbi:hypothetical protein LguiA_022369 [Lonicera macranthoides]